MRVETVCPSVDRGKQKVNIRFTQVSLNVLLFSAVGVPSELDTSLVVGQTLPVTLLKIQDDYTFFVQPATEDVEVSFQKYF
jgi:hypothetical protein